MLAKREPDAGFARAAMWVLAPACLLGLSIALLAVGTVQSRESDPAAKARIAELQKELNEKLKQGADDAEIQRLFDAIEAVQRTEKAPAPKADPAPQPLPAPMAVPTPVPSPTPSETTPKKDPQKLVEPLPKELLDQYNKQIKEFDEMLQRTDDPAAKEAIKKSRDEFQKAFEKGLDNADGLKEKIREMQQEQRQQQQRQRDAFPFRNGRLQWDVGPMIMPDIEALNRQNQQMLRQLMQMQGGLRNNLFLAPGQPRLGVVVERPAEVVIEQLDLPRNSGITIVEVQANSVAEKAGFKPNDIVLELAGKPVPSEPVDFQEFIAGLKAEEKFDAVVLRKGKKEKIAGIQLPAKPQDPFADFPRFGGNFGRIDLFPGAGGNFSQFQMSVNNGQATINARENNIEYKIEGVMENGKIVPSKIEIIEGDNKVKVESIDQVPEKYKEAVERLVARKKAGR